MSYILDSIKALFTKNTTNAASQSGARVPIMSADGTPIGVDTMANLASVMGAVFAPTYYTIQANGELQFSKGYCLVHITYSSAGKGCFFRFDSRFIDISSDLETFSIGEITQGFICITRTGERSFIITNKRTSSAYVGVTIV